MTVDLVVEPLMMLAVWDGVKECQRFKGLIFLTSNISNMEVRF